MELGVPVCILEDQHGFVLHHRVMWKGSDVDYAVPMVEGAQARHPNLRPSVLTAASTARKIGLVLTIFWIAMRFRGKAI